MPYFYLAEKTIAFPHPSLTDDYGILAVGGDLSAARLLEAYRMGIFPWFNEGEPILWWSPDPRFVLFPDELKVSHSMRPYFNQKKFTVTLDQQFEAVMRLCGSSGHRGRSGGTWISEDMIKAYTRLHKMGFAHSVEVWKGEALVGGLYGLSLGKVFFGESMFALEANASKFGFITLVKLLTEKGFQLIDCQQETNHLGSLGARAIDREQFLDLLKLNEKEETWIGRWTMDSLPRDSGGGL
jgi:leucyl/phenylalanyl-tRNA--protein transferase